MGERAGQAPVDLFVIGGGINGCGIARDAAGRGLSVMLAEMDDLGSATSSASTKLFHGGLRYLDYFEFRLVREALVEREKLLRAMPHISWPLRFVLPYDPQMRFEGQTPASRLLNTVMPWLNGRRPAWLIRLGLVLYDHLGGRKILPPTRSLDLTRDPAGAALQPRFARGYEYSDCWVDDSRLVALNARDAAEKGATVLTRTQVVSARRADGLWKLVLRDRDTGVQEVRQARVLVNAAGPWVAEVIATVIHDPAGKGADRSAVRLVRGSHIVTRRLFDHDRCYFFQGTDGRIVFAIPYVTDFTLIGTTDCEHPDPDETPVCTPAERAYLLRFASAYLRVPVTEADIVWSFSGVRPLYDDGAPSATAATRDYVLKLEQTDELPLLNVFGGKITTYRRLAEAALEKIAPFLPGVGDPWTAGAPLPGGDFPVDGFAELLAELQARHPFLDDFTAHRLARSYGTDAARLLGAAETRADLGHDFGCGLSEREVAWLMDKEFARTAVDVLWRRSKLGLRLSAEQAAGLEAWMARRRVAHDASPAVTPLEN